MRWWAAARVVEEGNDKSVNVTNLMFNVHYSTTNQVRVRVRFGTATER